MQKLPKCGNLGALKCLEVVGAQLSSFLAALEVLTPFEHGSIVAARHFLLVSAGATMA